MASSIEHLQCYLVGGAVRDELLGRPSPDRDWVVVGATEQQLLALDFVRVGKDFPVFLHPQTKEEHALARTERKRGQGHRGFVVDARPDVTLEQDLGRRDLTINAIAKTSEGHLIDPYKGQQDLHDRVLRHVSEAFIDDPLRVFRVARFAAQLPGFTVAAETQALMRNMTAAGELETLSAERVWQEFAKALGAAQPQRWFQVLAECGGLTPWLEELTSATTHQFDSGTSEQRFALLPWSVVSLQSLAKRLRIPKHYLQLATDRLSYGDVLRSYPWSAAQAEEVLGALIDLQLLHDGLRCQRLVQALGLDAAGPNDEVFNNIRLGLRDIQLPADHDLVGSAYGEALNQLRLNWLQNYLAR